jgi:hypothetical protein
MQECNSDPGTSVQDGSESEDTEGHFDQKEVSEHEEYDGQVPKDDDVPEDPVKEDEVQGTPTTLGSGLSEDDLEFAPRR